MEALTRRLFRFLRNNSKGCTYISFRPFACSYREGAGGFNFHISDSITYVYVLGVRHVQYF